MAQCSLSVIAKLLSVCYNRQCDCPLLTCTERVGLEVLCITGASELAVSILRHLMRPLGPSTVWQAIHGMLTVQQSLTGVCTTFMFVIHPPQHSLVVCA